jgi:pimeloyl-ACP methyl ester carboxylesterase
MNRRKLFKKTGATVANVGLFALPSLASAVQPDVTFVLIHGAWHAGSCWGRVAAVMSDAGHNVITLDLPGHGLNGVRFPRSYKVRPLDGAAFGIEASPLKGINAATFRDYVVDVVDRTASSTGGKVILVGHSLGGVTCTSVAEAIPAKIKHVCYVTAAVPINKSTASYVRPDFGFGDSLVTQTPLAPPPAVGAWRIDPNSTNTAYRQVLKDTFYADLSEEDFRAMGNLLSPDEPYQTFEDVIAVTAARWGSVKRTFVKCLNDRALRPATQQGWIDEADAFAPANKFTVVELAASHSPFLSKPKELAQILMTLA